jgi:hypothetical protein
MSWPAARIFRAILFEILADLVSDNYVVGGSPTANYFLFSSKKKETHRSGETDIIVLSGF